jgi:hypothetical protein
VDRFGGIAQIEEGPLAGRKFLLPSVVWVEKGTGMNGQPEFAKACLRHSKFIPDQGCPECATELAKQAELNEAIGL